MIANLFGFVITVLAGFVLLIILYLNPTDKLSPIKGIPKNKVRFFSEEELDKITKAVIIRVSRLSIIFA